MSRSIEPGADHTCVGASHISSLRCDACKRSSRLSGTTRPCPQEGCTGVLFGDERSCFGGCGGTDRRPGPDTSGHDPIGAVSHGLADERCMSDAAWDWIAIALEVKGALSVSHPSAVRLATEVFMAYPDLDTYGLFLACQWATTATPTGA